MPALPPQNGEVTVPFDRRVDVTFLPSQDPLNVHLHIEANESIYDSQQA